MSRFTHGSFSHPSVSLPRVLRGSGEAAAISNFRMHVIFPLVIHKQVALGGSPCVQCRSAMLSNGVAQSVHHPHQTQND